ncbi:MAG: thioredoxin-like domain-containing protein [Planctomycetota bacterium]
MAGLGLAGLSLRFSAIPPASGILGVFVWCFVSALGLAGCAPPAATATGKPAAPAAVPVTVRLVDHAGLETEIARHRGKVVVLDCWSTSCPPCVKEFPRLVALQEKFPDDIVCISLSFDYEGIGSPADSVPRVRNFLEDVGAGRIVNLLGSEEADSLSEKLDLVSVPAVFVYRPDGSLAQRFDDDDAKKRLGRAFTYDDVETTVRSVRLGTGETNR